MLGPAWLPPFSKLLGRIYRDIGFNSEMVVPITCRGTEVLAAHKVSLSPVLLDLGTSKTECFTASYSTIAVFSEQALNSSEQNGVLE
jgi:hypothetical protein